MKKTILRVTSLALVLVMAVLTLASCDSTKIYKLTDSEYGTYSIREDEYKYFLGYYKASLVASLAADSTFSDTEEYWNTELNAAYTQLFGENVRTNGDLYEYLYRSAFDQSVMTYLFCQLFYDQYGLEDTELWKKHKTNADNVLMAILSYYGLSVGAVNQAGASCDVTYDLLERVYTLQAKASCVREYLYGADGKKVDPALAEEFYRGSDAMEENGYLGYAAYKSIAIHTDRRVEEVVAEDGSVTYKLVSLSAEEKEYKTKLVKEIQTLLGLVGGYEGEFTYEILRGDETFDELYETYSEDKTYELEYVRTTVTPSNYELVNKLAIANVGDYLEAPLSYTMTTTTGAVEREVGVEIVQKRELEDKAYEKEENAQFFSDFYSTLSGVAFYTLLREKQAVYSSAAKYNTNNIGNFTIYGAATNTLDYPLMNAQ